MAIDKQKLTNWIRDQQEITRRHSGAFKHSQPECWNCPVCGKPIVKHIVEEGARYHVHSYDSNGIRCSTKDCEDNHGIGKCEQKMNNYIITEEQLTESYSDRGLTDKEYFKISSQPLSEVLKKERKRILKWLEDNWQFFEIEDDNNSERAQIEGYDMLVEYLRSKL